MNPGLLRERKSVPTAANKTTKPAKPQAGLGRGVYEQIRHLIGALKPAPGAPISESQLTLRLGVSRTPIRHMLLRLEQDGFVVAHCYGSVSSLRVAPLTIEDIKELHAIFSTLEDLSARLVAQLSDEPRQDLAVRLRKLNDELRVAWQMRPGRLCEAQDLHVAFHRTLDEAVVGRRLSNELRALQHQVERYERFYTAALVDAGQGRRGAPPLRPDVRRGRRRARVPVSTGSETRRSLNQRPLIRLIAFARPSTISGCRCPRRSGPDRSTLTYGEEL